MTRPEALRLAIAALQDQHDYLVDLNSRERPVDLWGELVDMAAAESHPGWAAADRDELVEAILARREALEILRVMSEERGR